MTEVFCGIDWAEGHHDIALVDLQGTVLASQRIEDTAAGLAELLDLLSTHGDKAEDHVPVTIETSRGLLVAALRSSGRDVYAINPMAVARYRDRHTVSRKKSDARDAAALANILRTDRHAHRPLPRDSELVQAIAVLARAQQDAVWDRQQHANRNRSLLRDYYPSALKAFPHTADLSSLAARLLLRTAPTPSQAAALPGCGGSCSSPAGPGTSMPPWPASSRSSAKSRCTNRPGWKSSSAPSSPSCSASSTPPATALMP